MPYNIDEIVVYGTTGVCRIDGITEKDFGNKKGNYYVLKPLYQNSSTVFVPVDNEKLVNKFRKVLSATDIYALIEAMKEETDVWIENETERKNAYREIISSGDRRELVRLIKTLYLHQQEQLKNGKKLHLSDERFMKEAEKLLYDEFAAVLNIKQEQVLPLIMERIQKNKGQ